LIEGLKYSKHSFFNSLNCFPMKRHVKKGGMAVVLSLFFVLGGMFLVQDVQAQQHAFTQVVSPQQSWISQGAALSAVTAEVNKLTTEYQQMKQAGAEPTQLQKLKLEIQLYLTIQKALEHGFSTQEAFEKAWESLGLGIDADSASANIMAPSDAKVIYDRALEKLTD
jgi:hypothetical protein